MKRDMDLVRRILLFIEAQPAEWDGSIDLEGEDTDHVAYNLAKMEEAGLINAHLTYVDGTAVPFVQVQSMTNLGHDFIDLAKSSRVWEYAKKRIAEAAIDGTIAVYLAYMKIKAKEIFGVDFEQVR